MRFSVLAATALAAFATTAFAQGTPSPAAKPESGSTQSGDDAMTDVDPEVLARCKHEAVQKKLKGADRRTFMNACVEPED